MTNRSDMGIVLISQHVAEMIRNLIADYDKIFPTILEIPSKESGYDIEKDTILQRAARMLYGADAAQEKLKEESQQNTNQKQ